MHQLTPEASEAALTHVERLTTPWGILEYHWYSRKNLDFHGGFDTWLKDGQFLIFGDGPTASDAATNTIRHAGQHAKLNVETLALQFYSGEGVHGHVEQRWENDIQRLWYYGTFWYRLIPVERG